MSKILTLKQSRQAALRGETEIALQPLRTYADRGDASASASLAELLAFRGEWTECMQRAGKLIARPQSVYAGNVFDDMVRLLRRAGRETGDWMLVSHLAQAAEKQIEDNIMLDAPSKKEAQRKRYSTILQALREYGRYEGVATHEFIPVFEVERTTQRELDIAYGIAKQKVMQQRPDLRSNPVDLASHLFSLARNFQQEAEAIRLYERGDMPANFDYAVFTAIAYMRSEQAKNAWEVLWKHMCQWWPLDVAQLAPVILLIDPNISTLMNRERCEQVLSLPRGPESRKKVR